MGGWSGFAWRRCAVWLCLSFCFVGCCLCLCSRRRCLGVVFLSSTFCFSLTSGIFGAVVCLGAAVCLVWLCLSLLLFLLLGAVSGLCRVFAGLFASCLFLWPDVLAFGVWLLLRFRRCPWSLTPYLPRPFLPFYGMRMWLDQIANPFSAHMFFCCTMKLLNWEVSNLWRDFDHTVNPGQALKPCMCLQEST